MPALFGSNASDLQASLIEISAARREGSAQSLPVMKVLVESHKSIQTPYAQPLVLDVSWIRERGWRNDRPAIVTEQDREVLLRAVDHVPLRRIVFLVSTRKVLRALIASWAVGVMWREDQRKRIAMDAGIPSDSAGRAFRRLDIFDFIEVDDHGRKSSSGRYRLSPVTICWHAYPEQRQ